MTRYLAILGSTLVGAVALLALTNPFVGAVEEQTIPAYIEASVGNEETAKIDGSQIGTNKITIGENAPLTCESIDYNGEAMTPGEASARVLITPKYTTCHVIDTFLGTRTATVAMNGCGLELTAQETITESEEGHFVAETGITCPEGKEIEIVVYNTSNPSHSGASALCTFKVKPQSGLTGTTLTNEETDIVADFNIESIAVTSSGLCSGETATYEGEATIRATNAKSEFVQNQVANPKRLIFDEPKAVAKGEKGEIELKTEKVTVKCTSYEYKAEPGVPSPPELAFKPTYANCTAFGGKNEVQIKPEGCQYKTKFNKDLEFVGGKQQTPSYFEVSCGAGESIKVTVTKENDKVNVECSIVIPKQNPVDTLKYRNNLRPQSKLKVDTLILIHDVSGLSYEPKNNPTTCGKNQLLTDGKLVEGSVAKELLVKATDAGGKEINVIIVGRMAP